MITSLNPSEPLAASGFPDAAALQELANRILRGSDGFPSAPSAPSVTAAPVTQELSDPRGSSGSPTSPSAPSLPATPGLPTGLINIPGVPDDAQLRALLAPRQPTASEAVNSPSGAVPSATSAYYFLDHPRPTSPAVPATAIVAADPRTAPVPHGVTAKPPFDLHRVRSDFPILSEHVNGKRLIWLDNAATTQKPRQVIDRLRHFYEHENSNIHRAAHALAARATDAYEGARDKVKAFINAGSSSDIVFVRGTTEAINLIAHSWGRANLKTDDEILLSVLEHHANIVPWQQVAAVTGARIKVIPVDDSGQILLDEYAKLLSKRTKVVSFTQVSNALGTITPAKQMVAMAHAVGARVLVDGAQSVSHMRSDVRDLDSDWFVFSGHKIFGPTGIGVLHGKPEVLESMPPWQGGGNMIVDVTFERTTYHEAPSRFEAGTGNIADAVGLGAALDYVTSLGIEAIGQYEHQLLGYATGRLREVSGLRPIGTAHEKASVLSFVLDGFTTAEVGKELDRDGIAVRSGHHCAQPILRRFGLESTVRPSLAFYNTCADVDALIASLQRIVLLRGRTPGR